MSPWLQRSLLGPAPDTIHAVDERPVQGELQAQLMAAAWRSGGGTVEALRAAMPAEYEGGYTTVQTVLNRLAARGLLDRVKDGRGFRYVPRLTEADYITRAIEGTLAGASSGARQAALAQLIGDLDDDQVGELRALAREADRQRGDS